MQILAYNMKKVFVVISVLALLTSSCSTLERDSLAVDNVITFQTANTLTKADGSLFPSEEQFSVYAWTLASSLPDHLFMDNVTVLYDETQEAWIAQGDPYYWPKRTTVDFLAYYPSDFPGLTVAPGKLTFEGVKVGDLQRDLMFSDKAVGYTDSITEVDGGMDASDGVPIVFHHSTSRVKVIAELAYNHKEEEDGTVTDWEVAVNSVRVDSIYTTGSAVFTLATTPEQGLVGWENPAGNVWTHDDVVTTINGSFSGDIVPGTTYTVVDDFYVLPQMLTPGMGQKLTISLTIKTKRNGVDVLREDFSRAVYLHSNALPAWEINHAYTYRLQLGPAASSGNGGSATDPDLSDAVISFDPAVDGWQGIGVETSIEI